jgi:hypothetical protein
MPELTSKRQPTTRRSKTMGIRMTQIYGLNEAAAALISGDGENFLAYTEEVTRRYEDGTVETLQHEGQRSTVVSDPSGEHYYGMFDGEEYPLLRHRLPGGRVFVEREYASPWASGPCIFLALVEEGGEEWDPGQEAAYADYGRGRRAAWVRETLWSDEEITSSI